MGSVWARQTGTQREFRAPLGNRSGYCGTAGPAKGTAACAGYAQAQQVAHASQQFMSRNHREPPDVRCFRRWCSCDVRTREETSLDPEVHAAMTTSENKRK